MSTITSLQETYGDPSLEDVWRAEWGGEILFAHGFKPSKGAMILFKGRTIRKLMWGEGGWGGRSTKKNSRKGKLNEKTFLHAN